MLVATDLGRGLRRGDDCNNPSAFSISPLTGSLTSVGLAPFSLGPVNKKHNAHQA